MESKYSNLAKLVEVLRENGTRKAIVYLKFVIDEENNDGQIIKGVGAVSRIRNDLHRIMEDGREDGNQGMKQLGIDRLSYNNFHGDNQKTYTITLKEVSNE